jgi:hypothetical protein
MLGKVDFKKDFKELYAPATKPQIITVPRIKFAVIDGQGDPNGADFAKAIEALYAFSYAVKMSYRSLDVPPGYYDYKVFPLEGVWDLMDKGQPITDKSNYQYQIMIRQPDFVTDQLAVRFIAETSKKKHNECLLDLRLEEQQEGLCCQMLHIGRYDDEPASFEIMDRFCRDKGYRRIAKSHREIYLSDPRKTEQAKLKTILRYRVAKN